VKHNAEIKDWSQRYQAALNAFLRRGADADARPAARLGRQAAALGLETLNVAKVHERVLNATPPPKGAVAARRDRHAAARRFFAETLVPIERTHRSARKAEDRVKELTRTLQQRKRETAASQRKLKQGIVRRQSAEAASHDVDRERVRLLKESDKLQRRLRHRLRKLMVLQEAGRRKHSRRLRDEIAQTLLALDVRLLALKEAGLAGLQKLSKEIAEAQGLVRQSEETLTRLAHDGKTQK
jgi:chromosome segregation ATPase